MATTRIKAYTARELGVMMKLPHKEIIRRIRKGDIKAEKLGWFWIITAPDAKAALESSWYEQYKR